MQAKSSFSHLIAICVFSALSVVALAQEEQAEEKQAATADAVARELANPNTVLGSLNFNFDYSAYKGDLPGASDQSATRVTFQPVFPYPISKSTNFYLRPAVPIVIAQDVPATGGFENKGVELGDISFDAAFGKSLPGGKASEKIQLINKVVSGPCCKSSP